MVGTRERAKLTGPPDVPICPCRDPGLRGVLHRICPCRVRAASVPRYRLIDEQGDDLGPFLTAAPTWTAGDTIYRGRSSLVVVSLRPALDGDDIDGYLVVKAAESPTA